MGKKNIEYTEVRYPAIDDTDWYKEVLNQKYSKYSMYLLLLYYVKSPLTEDISVISANF